MLNFCHHLVFVAQGAGVSKPDDWFELLRAEFDQLYEEGQAGAPKMMCVLLHLYAFCIVPNSLTLQDYRHAQPFCMQTWPDYGAQEVHGICCD